MSQGMQRSKGKGRALMSKRSLIEDWVRSMRADGVWFPTAREVSDRFEVSYEYARKMLADFREEMR